VIRLLYRQAQLRGLLGGSRGWTVLWGLLFGARLVRRVTSDKPQVVYRQKIVPGQVLVIRNGDRPVRVLGGEPS
jgi:hypothetical protein